MTPMESKCVRKVAKILELNEISSAELATDIVRAVMDEIREPDGLMVAAMYDGLDGGLEGSYQRAINAASPERT